MHIVWVNDHADFTGGCEHYVYATARQLRARGHRCTLLYKVGSPISPDFTHAFDGAFPMVETDRQLRMLSPDIVYIHQLASLDNLKTIQASPFRTVRFYHDHKLFCLREHKYTTISHQTCTKPMGAGCYRCLGFINKADNGIGIRTLSAAEQELRLNRKLDHFVVGSHYMADQVAAHGFDKSRIVIAPLFTDQNKATTVQCHSKRNGGLNLLFVGQLIRGKGLDTLLEALSQTRPHVGLTICGTGAMEANYKQQALKLGLTDRVRFAGKQTSDALNQFYVQADAVVIPARAPETFCLVGIEALLRGKPVIASNVGGMSDWFKPEFNGLECRPNHTSSLVQAIDRLTSDGSLLTRLMRNIKADDYSKFTAIHHAELLENTFARLMEAC